MAVEVHGRLVRLVGGGAFDEPFARFF